MSNVSSYMHPDISSLANMLDEAASLLRKHNIDHWAKWLSKDADLIRRLDFYGIQHLLSGFGGMGSLNDVGLARRSAINPNNLEISPDDTRFQSLLSEIYSLAKKLEYEESQAKPRS